MKQICFLGNFFQLSNVVSISIYSGKAVDKEKQKNLDGMSLPEDAKKSMEIDCTVVEILLPQGQRPIVLLNTPEKEVVELYKNFCVDKQAIFLDLSGSLLDVDKVELVG